VFDSALGLRGMRSTLRVVLHLSQAVALVCASLTMFAGISVAQQGSFVLTGSMNSARTAQATATLLNNGKVLVAGGWTATFTPTASAELYDPTTGTFTATGSMTTSRSNHTATLLQNGKVLIAGGADSTVLSSAELYDPTTGTFTLTGSMSDGHSQGAAALLSNGMVLVAGGYDSNSEVATTELYDPSTGTFSPTGSMNNTLSGFTATLLNNGKVLIAGGFIENVGATASAELYDPTAGTFTATGSLNNSRDLQTATVLKNGTVLIAGGEGGSADTILASAELYDPSAGTFTVTGSLSAARVAHTASLLNDGTVLIAGGLGTPINSTDNPLATAELYDPTTGKFASTGILNVARAFQTATLLNNGTVLMAGGGAGANDTPLASAELYVFVAIAPTGLSFSNQTVGVASAFQTAVLTNNQTTALTITGVTVNGMNGSDFLQTNNCGSSVAAAASCSLNVTFTPGALGSRAGNLGIAISISGGGASLNVPLTGTGATAPQVTITPSTITFPAQFVGTSGLPQSVTITNNGGTPLSITGVTASKSDFGLLNACGSTVAGGSSCAIGVFFDPMASGAITGTLTIADNAANTPQTVALTGSGQDFSMTAGAAASATVSPGQTASFSIAVAPAGGFAQSVAMSCTGGPAGSTCVVTPKTISLGGAASQTATVTVTTASQGSLLPFGSGWPTGTWYQPTRLLLVFMAMFLVITTASWLWRRNPQSRWVSVFAMAVLVCVAVTLSSCGGGSGGGGGGQAGTYAVAVTGNFSSGSTTLTHTANLTLVVK
jgi:hypothetical protein